MPMELVKKHRRNLDQTDVLILNELQLDGRLSNVELSHRVGLSPTACLERVKRLEKDGVIKGYSALLDPQLLNADLLVFVEIRLNHSQPDVFLEFKKTILTISEVLECHIVSGDFDYLLKARVASIKDFQGLLSKKLLVLPGVIHCKTCVVIEEVKEDHKLSLNGISE